jgi:hypothetical protein
MVFRRTGMSDLRNGLWRTCTITKTTLGSYVEVRRRLEGVNEAEKNVLTVRRSGLRDNCIQRGNHCILETEVLKVRVGGIFELRPRPEKRHAAFLQKNHAVG